MSAVTKNDIPDAAKFMSELWDLVKEFYIPEDNDAYWQSYVAKTDKLVEDHHNDDLVVYLILGLTNYLETKLRGKSYFERK